MKKNKKGIGTGMWILIILILIIIGIGVYFLLSGDGTSIIPRVNSIPQPPALPS